MHADPDPVLVAYPSPQSLSFYSLIYPSDYTPEQLTVHLKGVLEQGLLFESEVFPLPSKYTFGGIDSGVKTGY